MKKIVLFIAMSFITTLSFSQSQAEMNEEAFNAYSLADKKMYESYKQILANFSTKVEKDLLIASQKAWIIYKEAHCKSIANGYEGGSMQPLIYNSCMESITNERIIQLNQYNEE
jgi:uncharacterized protein YecT (DUF1311 family)